MSPPQLKVWGKAEKPRVNVPRRSARRRPIVLKHRCSNEFAAPWSQLLEYHGPGMIGPPVWIDRMFTDQQERVSPGFNDAEPQVRYGPRSEMHTYIYRSRKVQSYIIIIIIRY